MSATMNYGYRSGERCGVPWPLADGVTVNVGDLMTKDSNGFCTPATAGDKVYGVSMDKVPTAGAADGDIVIVVDTSPDTLYEYPPASGSVSQAIVGKTCDSGGVKSVDVTASTNDDLFIVGMNSASNVYYVKLRVNPAGVV